MEEILVSLFSNGELSLTIILGAIVIWFIRSFWPGYVERTRDKIASEKELREYEMKMEERIRQQEIEAQQASYQALISSISNMTTEMESVRATLNDFLQNLLSQYMEERRELIDTGFFRKLKASGESLPRIDRDKG